MTVYLNRFMTTEDVTHVVYQYRDIAIFQEELTQQLANLFGGVVRTSGAHGKVYTVCMAKPVLKSRGQNPFVMGEEEVKK